MTPQASDESLGSQSWHSNAQENPAANSPCEHLFNALKAAEASNELVLDTEVRQALDRLIDDPVGTRRQQMSACAFWKNVQSEGIAQHRSWRDALPKEQQCVLGKLHPELMQKMLVTSAHTDDTYVADLCAGFNVTAWFAAWRPRSRSAWWTSERRETWLIQSATKITTLRT